MTTPRPHNHKLLTAAKLDAAIADLEHHVGDRYRNRDIRAPFKALKGAQRMSKAQRAQRSKFYREELRSQVGALRALRMVKAVRTLGI